MEGSGDFMPVGGDRQGEEWRRIRPKKGHLTANNGSFPQQRATRVGVVSSKIAKICGVHAGVPSPGAPFILRRGYK